MTARRQPPGPAGHGVATPPAAAGMTPNAFSDVLSEFARTMVTDFPIQGILDHLVKRIVEIMPVTSAGVTLIAPGLAPHYVAASDAAALRFERLQTELDEGPCLAAYRTGGAIAVADLRQEDRFRRFGPRAVEVGLAAVFTFPLYHRDLRLGALDLYRDEPGVLSVEWMIAAQTLADVAAAYLINAQARSDLQDASDQSREAALHDALTGLPNRALISQLLAHAFRRSRRSQSTSALFFVDLDRFKEVNDIYGHQVGDELLVAVAQRLTAALRPGDTLARLAGDEFVILCEELNHSHVEAVTRRVREAVSRPFALSAGAIAIEASVGVALAGRDADCVEDLLRAADLAMYREKHSRTGPRAGDMPRMNLAGYQARLAGSLDGAVTRGELHIAYQPIVDTIHGGVTAVEALLRWAHPSRGEIPPSVFVPFAEQSGEIIEIGRWVLGQVWSERHHWQRSAEVAVSVNVSANQFMSHGFATTVAEVVAGAPGAAGLLTLEITESVLLRDEARALVVLQELKDIGVKLALDDFGTGYSSLGYLNTLPIDTIKVDRSFIASLSVAPRSQIIVSAIVGLAHSLQMTVIAEGVETAEQHHRLAELGSDCCQGFYFARPMAAQKLRTFTRHPPDRSISRR